ncbi:MAG: hypothetical protein LBB08_01390, partial [Rickettsiales bacterium]|nr:hypothetical protein [Rickettsiales bacterium]
GMAYIDLTPEAYLRISGGWAMGFGATLRKSTTSAFDQEWLNFKLGATVGYTGYYANAGYEMETGDMRVGASLNMLF